MTATNMCSNFVGFRSSPPLTELRLSYLMKIVIESPEKLLM